MDEPAEVGFPQPLAPPSLALGNLLVLPFVKRACLPTFCSANTVMRCLQEVSSASLARAVSRSGEKGAAKVPRGFLDAHGNKTNLLFSALPPHPSEGARPGSAQHSRSVKSLVPDPITAKVAADAGS